MNEKEARRLFDDLMFELLRLERDESGRQAGVGVVAAAGDALAMVRKIARDGNGWA